MQKLNSVIIIFISAIAIITSGCKKESETNNTATQSDARDNAVGSYRGTYYYTHNSQTQTEARTVLITKGANNNLIIDLGTGFIVTTDAVNVFGKDISGSISEQNVLSFTVKGEGVMGSHFAYSESNGKSAFTCHINLKQPGFQSTVLFLGYK
jgi:hypothetical protein